MCVKCVSIFWQTKQLETADYHVVGRKIFRKVFKLFFCVFRVTCARVSW